ncbi:dnaJ-like protein 60 isoform X2 [Chrysoperla carnea]|uniref:dnaJ-like protein 60 isoform X2 n=1 Tax=Chrysoperla carnea TaxID=189513 RepID=UPI001D09798C|nr:dnaJ-like protein 60 isoform X2 [Chrysoperla carnea]
MKRFQIYSQAPTTVSDTLKAKCYYDILEIPIDSTAKDIRTAYIKLSKKLHPDRNKTKDTSREFVQLNEAYQTLSDPIKRREYDFGRTTTSNSYKSNTNNSGPRNVHEMYGFDSPKANWSNTSMGSAYYGIKGVNRISNFWIVMICLLFTSLGVGLQILAIRESFTFQRKQLDQKSLENAQILSSVRARANDGNDIQLERLRRKAEAEQRIYISNKKNVTSGENSFNSRKRRNRIQPPNSAIDDEVCTKKSHRTSAIRRWTRKND